MALAPQLKMLPRLEQLACKDNWWVKLRSSEIRGGGVLAFGTGQLEGLKSWHDGRLEHTTSNGPYYIREKVGGHGLLLDLGPDVCLRSCKKKLADNKIEKKKLTDLC